MPDLQKIPAKESDARRLAQFVGQQVSGYLAPAASFRDLAFYPPGPDTLAVQGIPMTTIGFDCRAFQAIAWLGYRPGQWAADPDRLGEFVLQASRRIRGPRELADEIQAGLIDQLQPAGCGCLIEAATRRGGPCVEKILRLYGSFEGPDRAAFLELCK